MIAKRCPGRRHRVCVPVDAGNEDQTHRKIRVFVSISIVFVIALTLLYIVAVGLAVTISVLTTEMLKTRVLSRPSLDDVAGIAQNNFPSGHATIGMSLSLGMIMVAPHRWRWAAMAAALVLSLTFGIGVLATGWHRPSDVIAAYLVCTAVFAAITALLLHKTGAGDVGAAQFGEIEDRLTPRWAFLLGLLVVAAAGIALVLSFNADGLDTVDFASDYIIVCVMILALGSFIVIGSHEMLRGVSLDSPRQSRPFSAS